MPYTVKLAHVLEYASAQVGPPLDRSSDEQQIAAAPQNVLMSEIRHVLLADLEAGLDIAKPMTGLSH